MNKWVKVLKKYFILIGLLGNLTFFVIFGLLLNKISSLELSLPLFSEKVREQLKTNQPNLLAIVAPILDVMSLLKSKNYYFREVDIEQWSGIGAKKYFSVSSTADINVFNASELLSALKNVSAGQTIVVAPGEYVVDQFGISLNKSGTKFLPIRVIAQQLGTVKIFLRGEGFVVKKPYWQFHNLHLIGSCKIHSRCEHAFHVVGEGKHVLIENNIFQDFNAMIKVNGIGRSYPDYGKVIQNTLFNTSARNTANPVTPIDLMHANSWQVADNFIFDIQKSAGNQVSYAAFFKGGSQLGVFERNLIICAANLPGNYTSIALSLGGGGSPLAHRRDNNVAEHVNGTIRNNIIMHCANDVGIYLNKAANSQVHHNILYNTLGIDARFKETTAFIYNNVISGRVKSRDKGELVQKDNLIVKRNFFTGKDNLSEYFSAPDIGDFSWLNARDIGSYELSENNSFCGEKPLFGYLGAYSDATFCFNRLNLISRDTGVFK